MNVSHEINRDRSTTTWLTPPEIIGALGAFDLDPCTPPLMPWQTAKNRFTEAENGLIQPWTGRVWLNPPYGRGVDAWLEKMAVHGNGIALLFNRTDTDTFQRWVFPAASGMLFISGRLYFRNEKGEKVGRAGCGSVLIAYSQADADILKRSGIPGTFISMFE